MDGWVTIYCNGLQHGTHVIHYPYRTNTRFLFLFQWADVFFCHQYTMGTSYDKKCHCHCNFWKICAFFTESVPMASCNKKAKLTIAPSPGITKSMSHYTIQVATIAQYCIHRYNRRLKPTIFIPSYLASLVRPWNAHVFIANFLTNEVGC